MKIKLNPKRRPEGFILLLVIVLSACSLFILAGVLSRTSTVSMLNMRNTQLSAMNNAAEAATEKVFARMASDFQYGPGMVSSNLTQYRSFIPTGTDNGYWTNVEFSDANGHVGSTYVSFMTNYSGPLPTQYSNQFAALSPVYRIVSNARATNSLGQDVIGTAQEDVLLALVPITTYAIFYNGPLEFSDCATMIVNGRVHSNNSIAVGAGSGASLTFNGAVTCCGILSAPDRGGITFWTENDPSTWLTTFNANYATNVASINVSFAMTNAHAIIDVPPAGESPLSTEGITRLYNEAQVVIVVTNGASGASPTVMVTLQTPYNGTVAGNDPTKTTTTLLNATDTYMDTNAVLKVPFLSLTNTFADQRQNQSAQLVTQIDVAQYNRWLSTNAAAVGKFNNTTPATILYVADRRTSGSKQAVVRLVNGSQLPNNNGQGFSVATPNPLYVQGNYNITVTNVSGSSSALGSTTNGASVPAALLSDAITILSPSWLDSQSSSGYSSRDATSMTLNAALVTGAVPSTGTSASTFSGGVHNLTRFLEDWSNATLTMNTSIVNLFNSQTATAQFQMPGAYYDPPTRKWGFDTTYFNPSKQPPGVPNALVPLRFNWQKPPPGNVTSN